MHRVGAIPFTLEDDLFSLLFVTSQTRGRWIFPKGVVKKNESHIQTCQRETLEESGMHGTVLENFPLTVPIQKQTDEGKIAFPVTFYPLLVEEQHNEWLEMNERKRQWTLLDNAPKLCDGTDYLNLIAQFKPLTPWIRDMVLANKVF